MSLTNKEYGKCKYNRHLELFLFFTINVISNSIFKDLLLNIIKNKSLTYKNDIILLEKRRLSNETY